MTGRDGGLFVTFDLFSALIDSRTGGSTHFARIALDRGWALDGRALYDDWDRRNKISQRDTREWITFAEHSRRALDSTYRHFGLDGDVDVDADAEGLLVSVAQWPVWPGVTEGLPSLSARFMVGILSNVDDDIFRRTAVAPMVDDGAVLTSERLRSYKPAAAIYQAAVKRAGDRRLVHVASSARDVRGATEAAIPVIRLVRPGHDLDPDGPEPAREARSLDEVARYLHGESSAAGDDGPRLRER